VSKTKTELLLETIELVRQGILVRKVVILSQNMLGELDLLLPAISMTLITKLGRRKQIVSMLMIDSRKISRHSLGKVTYLSTHSAEQGLKLITALFVFAERNLSGRIRQKML
jgi:hypothetical protein